jgi:hypothetical protein
MRDPVWKRAIPPGNARSRLEMLDHARKTRDPAQECAIMRGKCAIMRGECAILPGNARSCAENARSRPQMPPTALTS